VQKTLFVMFALALSAPAWADLAPDNPGDGCKCASGFASEAVGIPLIVALGLSLRRSRRAA
jgi:MYXO-CTERM domain-containing protein